MPNLFAYIVLFSWPLVVIVLFRTRSIPAALIWSILAGYLLLPEKTAVDFPLLPTFDKSFMPAISAAIMCLVLGGKGVRGAIRGGAAPRRTNLADTGQADPAGGDAPISGPAFSRASTMSGHAPDAAANNDRTDADLGLPARRRGPLNPVSGQIAARRKHPLFLLALGTLLIIPFGIFMTNGEPIFAGWRYISAMRLYDGFSMALGTIVLLLPFVLARRYLATPEATVMLLRALVVAGLAYSLLILLEIRISPQLHRMFYGFHAHSFVQQMRNGGFRSTVFIEHGLRVAILLSMTCLAAAALWRHARQAAAPQLGRGNGSRVAKTASPGRWLLALVWLAAVLVLSKTLGALLITIMLLPVVLLLGPRLQILIAACLAGIILLYPMMRGAGMVPTQAIYEMAANIDADRAGSLKFRLDNEDALLDRANEKPLLGWGSWGRNRIYDPDTGQDLSVTDGTWIIIIGTQGWIGYLAMFGLLTFPVLLAIRQRQFKADPAVAGLCLVLTANLIDLIPNSGLTPVTWLIAGALAGRIEHAARSDPADALAGAPRGQGRRSNIETSPRPAMGTARQPAQRRSAVTPERPSRI